MHEKHSKICPAVSMWNFLSDLYDILKNIGLISWEKLDEKLQQSLRCIWVTIRNLQWNTKKCNASNSYDDKIFLRQFKIHTIIIPSRPTLSLYIYVYRCQKLMYILNALVKERKLEMFLNLFSLFHNLKVLIKNNSQRNAPHRNKCP